MATIHGRGGKLKLGATVLLEAREWTINITRDKDEDEAFGDAWRTNLGGIKSWSMTAECNYDPAVVAIHDAALADTVTAMTFYPVGSAAPNYAGNVWVEVDITIGVGGTGRISISGDGDGPLAYSLT